MSVGRVYYGWWILVTLLVGAFLASGASALFMGVMLKPMSSELGWSRTTTTSAITFSTLLAGVMTFFIGRSADRFSPRVVAPVAGLIVAGGFIVIGWTNHLWQFYLGYVMARTLGPSGIGTIIPMTTAAHWFQRHRGRAFGLIAMMLPLGGALLAPVAEQLIDAYDWRLVFVLLAAALVVFFVLPAALVLRREPADAGIELEPAAENSASKEASSATNWTVSAALRSRALWLLMGSLFISSIATGSLTFHQVAYFTDQGISSRVAVSALSVYGFAGAVSSGLWGWLVERYSERVLSTLTLVASALCVLFLLTIHTAPMAFIFALGFGLSARGGGALIMLIIVQYYGRRFYGSISSFISMAQTIGLGLGPLFASMSFDATGSYRSIFLIFVSMLLVAAGLMWSAKAPAEPAMTLTPEAVSA